MKNQLLSTRHFAGKETNVKYTFPDDRVAIKAYAEGEGIDALLIQAGIIEPDPIDFCPSGYVTIPVYRLTTAAHAEAQAVARH